MTFRFGFLASGYRRLSALVAVLLMIVLVVLASTAKTTLAGWTDTDASNASYTAATIGPVESLMCRDSENAPALGLLARQVKLQWSPPTGTDSSALEYEVAWAQSGLLGGTGSATVMSTEYIYTAERLGLITLNVNFTVRAKSKAGTWVGPTRSASATSISLLGLGLILKCNVV